jgi:uncharacterized FlaG/YvyC family protein
MNISSLDAAGTAMQLPANTALTEQGKTVSPSGHVNTTAGNADPSPKQLKQMVEDMQGQLDSMNISLRYSLYGENEMKIAVKVVNKNTGDVIREIPPKELQALQSKMNDLVGMIFDKKG